MSDLALLRVSWARVRAPWSLRTFTERAFRVVSWTSVPDFVVRPMKVYGYEWTEKTQDHACFFFQALKVKPGTIHQLYIGHVRSINTLNYFGCKTCTKGRVRRLAKICFQT
jgi:hypothetical protein